MDRATAALAGGGEDRPGQRQMARAVAASLASGRHLVVQAGTGTGKSLAYLVPAILSGRRVVVATATKALQDQLATHDLPLLRRALRHKFSYAVLKGKSNYLCLQRAGELAASQEQVTLASAGGAGRATALEDQVGRLLAWAKRSDTGDRAELSFEPSPRAWGLVSVSTQECPGRSRCPSGSECFAELAKERAGDVDVVVTNMHLYGAHLANDGTVLPPHDVVVFDEAHELEDVATASLGLEIGAARFRALAGAARPLLGSQGAGAASDLEAAGDLLDEALRPLVGRRLSPGLHASPTPGHARAPAHPPNPAPAHPPGSDTALVQAVELARERLARLTSALRQPAGTQGTLGLDISTIVGAMADPSRARALQAAGKLAEDLAKLDRLGPDDVAWVEGPRPASPAGPASPGAPASPAAPASPGAGTGHRHQPLAIRVAPIEVGGLLAERLWGEVTAVLTSATIPLGIAQRLGIPATDHDEADVGSPFPYPTNALLYCAAHLPDRRHPNAEAALHEELASLILAAGGRTLALFTSWRGMTGAAKAVSARVPFRVLAQDELPKAALLRSFSEDESVCLFATMGFWQGVDLPGRTLSLVVIDRIPFPRPDDPLLSARRDRAGAAAFRTIDLPRASMLLAQGAGRLIRSGSDRGVVAVLDRRLAQASYRWDLIRALPPMARTRHRSEVDRFLAEALTHPSPQPLASRASGGYRGAELRPGE